MPRRGRGSTAYSGIKIAALATIFLRGVWAMRIRISTCLAALTLALSAISAQAETVVRYGISMADIPLTTGQPDRGAGAYQFTAYTIYDPLVAWEMDVADRPGKLVPGLATEWKVD